MTGQHEGAALQRRIGQRLAEIVHVRNGALSDVGRVVVELDFEIDARSGLRDRRDLLALVGRERARRPVAQRIDELVRLSLLGLIGRRSRKAARQRRLGLQRIDDLLRRRILLRHRDACRQNQRGGDDRTGDLEFQLRRDMRTWCLPPMTQFILADLARPTPLAHAVPVELVGDAWIDRLGGRDVVVAAGIAGSQLGDASPIERRCLSRGKLQRRVVVGNGVLRLAHFQLDETPAVEAVDKVRP